ncbi:hypothetical protein BVRB_5g117860 [Beta vulgaris subsp. vulgaris]|nr:hypothetical protein BVRB_5g117860 [Beta vulgaris subsp. vulgaris]
MQKTKAHDIAALALFIILLVVIFAPEFAVSANDGLLKEESWFSNYYKVSEGSTKIATEGSLQKRRSRRGWPPPLPPIRAPYAVPTPGPARRPPPPPPPQLPPSASQRVPLPPPSS